MQSTYIRKVKILQAPCFDIQRLMEVHGDYTEETGSKLDRPAEHVVGVEVPAETAIEWRICLHMLTQDRGQDFTHPCRMFCGHIALQASFAELLRSQPAVTPCSNAERIFSMLQPQHGLSGYEPAKPCSEPDSLAHVITGWVACLT